MGLGSKRQAMLLIQLSGRHARAHYSGIKIVWAQKRCESLPRVRVRLGALEAKRRKPNTYHVSLVVEEVRRMLLRCHYTRPFRITVVVLGLIDELTSYRIAIRSGTGPVP